MVEKFPGIITYSELVVRARSTRSRYRHSPVCSFILVIRPKDNEGLGTVKTLIRLCFRK